MKKFLTIVLCIAMCAMVFASCTNAPAAESEAPASEAPASEAPASEAPASEAPASEAPASEAPAASGERIKIGVEFFDYAMPLGVDVKRMIDHAAAALDCDVEYAANDFDTEKVITNVENLFASGCQAVIMCNTAEGQIPPAMQVAEQYGGKVFQYFRTLADEEIKNAAWASAGYGGQVHEDEAQVGYNLGVSMADKGCKNVGIINYTRSDLTAQTRQSGYEKAFEEKGVNIVAETWDISTGEDAASTTEQYLAAYPEMDGLVVVGGSAESLFGAQTALENHGKIGEIVVSFTDFYEEMDADLASGKLSQIAGGHWCDPFYSFMLAYNYAAGAFGEGELPAEILTDMIYVTTPEEGAEFNKWFLGDEYPYYAEEIQQLSITYNPDFTLDDLKEAASKISIEDVKQRHGG